MVSTGQSPVGAGGCCARSSKKAQRMAVAATTARTVHLKPARNELIAQRLLVRDQWARTVSAA